MRGFGQPPPQGLRDIQNGSERIKTLANARSRNLKNLQIYWIFQLIQNGERLAIG